MKIENIYERAVLFCEALIEQNRGVNEVLTEKDIQEAVETVCNDLKNYDFDKEKLIVSLLKKYDTCMLDDTFIIEDRDRRSPWLDAYIQTHGIESLKFWGRYKKFLKIDKGLPFVSIRHIHKTTNIILDKLFDPNEKGGSLSKKGLVVGQVQSGKTANYTALVCKAADVGFRFIIILAGMHNSLRSQSQLRIDEGFLGRDTQIERTEGKKFGVGKYGDEICAHSLTTSKESGDFTKNRADSSVGFHSAEPIICVIKKNCSTLRNIHKWLESKCESSGGKKLPLSSHSLLIIDDEADHASINTKKKEKPSTINACILKLLGLFSRSAYVGYTATPYANFFIPVQKKEDLFPRDFIINLKAPDNYVGPEQVFAIDSPTESTNSETLPIIRTIRDHRDLVAKNNSAKDIPDSLKEAIKSFIITCATRFVRGQGDKHNSMLIHVSRFVASHGCIKALIEYELDTYKDDVEQSDEAIFEELEKLHESYQETSREFIDTATASLKEKVEIHSWDDIKKAIRKTINKIKVVEFNGKSKDALDYYTHRNGGLSVIAIGGDKLSRGLTLEGLSISYYLRSSKMYDTLMQMGRWFGYRDGYIDLCRLYISEDLNESFRIIGMADKAMRDDLDYLCRTDITPDEYALKIGSSPYGLQITAFNKLYHSCSVKASWGGRIIESYKMYDDKQTVCANYMTSKKFVSILTCSDYNKCRRSYLWKNINVKDILYYLEDFKLPNEHLAFNIEGVSNYIKKLNQNCELLTWNVAVMSSTKDSNSKYDFGNQIVGSSFVRNRVEDIKNAYCIRKNHIIAAQKDYVIDFEEDEIKQASSDFNNQSAYKSENRYIIEKKRKTPLLIIYPLDPHGVYDDKETCDESDPIIGLVIIFPETKCTEFPNFVINRDLLKFYGAGEDEDEG